VNDTGTLQGNSAISVPLPKRRGRSASPQIHENNAKYVYVIQRGPDNFCKVGISKSVRRRMSGLQVSTPDKLNLFFSMKPTALSAVAVEGAALHLLKPWKVGGEWVACHPFIARKVVEAVAAGEDISGFLGLLLERKIRWAAVETAQQRNETSYQNDETNAAFVYYRENERACWESRIDIMRMIDPWGAASYDPEDIGYRLLQAGLARPRRRKRVLTPPVPTIENAA
jgi:hypothetical protein